MGKRKHSEAWSTDAGIDLRGITRRAPQGGITQYGVNAPKWSMLAYRSTSQVADETDAKLMQDLTTLQDYADVRGCPESKVRLVVHYGNVPRASGGYFKYEDLDRAMQTVRVPRLWSLKRLENMGVITPTKLKQYREQYPKQFVFLARRIYFIASEYEHLISYVKNAEAKQKAVKVAMQADRANAAKMAKKASRFTPFSYVGGGLR